MTTTTLLSNTLASASDTILFQYYLSDAGSYFDITTSYGFVQDYIAVNAPGNYISSYTFVHMVYISPSSVQPVTMTMQFNPTTSNIFQAVETLTLEWLAN